MEYKDSWAYVYGKDSSGSERLFAIETDENGEINLCSWTPTGKWTELTIHDTFEILIDMADRIRKSRVNIASPNTAPNFISVDNRK